MIRWAASIVLLCWAMMTQAQTLDLDPQWEYVADSVMGGVSTGQAVQEVVQARDATRLSGLVSLDNNGGFVQIAFDLAGGAAFDASAFTGIALDVLGNGETYDLRLRTDALTRPWQSFRTEFTAPDTWTTIRLPFTAFIAHRTDASFDPMRLRRIGVLAIGREMQADIAVSGVRLYR
ncbi:CIA30 family protein [uncultured Tateyamaria sp.]|uniref:CIA30 family protein n=1 Tax=uncultured Tateyamaria sp. TaxID=455651 RepID=UPI00345D8F07